MKFSMIFFLGMMFMTSLFACAPVDWVTSPDVTVSWTAPTTMTDGTKISEDSDIRYELFIDIDQDNTHDDMIPLTDAPIKGTSFTTPKIEKLRKENNLEKGHYYLGLRAVLFENGKQVHPVSKSKIIWSSSKTDTSHKPFGVKIK